MPVLKSIAGHGASVRAAIEYLTKDDRAIAADFLNCLEEGPGGEPVWRQMDRTRRILGTDAPWHGRDARTWQHFVISPDPADACDLATLRDLSRAWARRYFAHYQVAIYYHDDNALRIPHAHVIVSNANLAPGGGRVSSELSTAFVRQAFLGLQEMAAERGLTPLAEREPGDARRSGTVQPTYVSHRDRELERRGVSWKRDVRDRMACAMRLSSTEGDYVAACRALGLGVREARGRRSVGELCYRHPSGSWEVLGSSLGRSWSREGVRRRLADDRDRGVVKPTGASRERLLEALGSLRRADGAMAMDVVGTSQGTAVTARMVSSMVDACAAWDVASLGDLDEAISEAGDGPWRARLIEARGLAVSLGWLPRERDRVDGARMGRAAGAGGPLAPGEAGAWEAWEAWDDQSVVACHDTPGQVIAAEAGDGGQEWTV